MLLRRRIRNKTTPFYNPMLFYNPSEKTLTERTPQNKKQINVMIWKNLDCKLQASPNEGGILYSEIDRKMW